jgi:hypothetical protein
MSLIHWVAGLLTKRDPYALIIFGHACVILKSNLETLRNRLMGTMRNVCVRYMITSTHHLGPGFISRRQTWG